MKNEKVTSYIEKHQKWKEALTVLRKIMLQTAAEETIKWGAPVYVAHGKNIAGLAAFKNHFSIWFFQGVFLKDNNKKLVSEQKTTAKAMRQWRFTSVEEIEEKLVLKYMEEAIENGKKVKQREPQKKEVLLIPELLQNALKKDSQLKKCFEKLPPYKQREYMEHISEAKQEKTKVSRLEKCIPLLLKGKGLHDKYKNC
ncbi:MAG: hypothetical protein COZ75_11260 [Flavobacteriaceae bacterium CG_4_8_14_3_um_filter_34_10]|nr:hypothetical protein [Flavobacteriia bacterium]OIP50194.1 MAG: hypothetical protein AUK33_08595 [Flavobacteriaceae bacterium CG2_30_34_30]PIQ19031.1 MAG: hypothetical protein COW66_03410 [Flavobacteriaceae bacterium CG18_big_fil_WC_8_21_14_2_50_34_36]PIV49380.1 MAG: hypothetical protein COS19_08555 [Flavobacteriaceae bacterium CG02_land_8_20_14_3_00_34_13]PIX08581.1 MAG: hypothetical protein COZ75_11260 [Flavobacteriaceae bacterium CG_4_8_14_3_um_filter_34_10]PIZ08804.1 MAG: hypothetical pr